MNWLSLLQRVKEAITFSQVLTSANILLVFAAAWMVGDFAAKIVENEVLQVPYQPAQYAPPQSEIQDNPRQFSEFNDILEQNVFNVEVARKVEMKTVEVVEVEAPGKILNDILNNLELLGIHYRRGFYIRAIIKNKKKNEEDIFTIDDQIFDTGATVHRIFTTFGNQRVLVKLGNEIGTLYYEEQEGIEQANSAQAKPTPTPRKRTAAVKKAEKPAADSKYSTDGTNFYITAAEVDSHLNDFGTLLNQARMVPYFKNKQHQGFRVKAIDSGSLYEKLGLRNNDIIKAVNGESLADAGGEKLMGMFSLLRNEREFTVKIERGGKEQVFNYYVN